MWAMAILSLTILYVIDVYPTDHAQKKSGWLIFLSEKNCKKNQKFFDKKMYISRCGHSLSLGSVSYCNISIIGHS